MIDIHTHILSGVDDGATGFDVSVAMLAMAAADGITDIVATPHANHEFRFDAYYAQSELDLLRLSCPAGVRLHFGCELNLTPENLYAALADPADYTLNGKDCLLIELPDSISVQAVDSSVRVLVDAGFRPIIAHAERNLYLQRHPAYAAHLVAIGSFLQITAGSIFGSFGLGAGQTAEHLLTQRIAHFVASDAHGITERRPLLRKAHEYVVEQFGDATARLLFLDNPRAAIEGGTIETMRESRRSRVALFFQSRLPGKRPAWKQISSPIND